MKREGVASARAVWNRLSPLVATTSAARAPALRLRIDLPLLCISTSRSLPVSQCSNPNSPSAASGELGGALGATSDPSGTTVSGALSASTGSTSATSSGAASVAMAGFGWCVFGLLRRARCLRSPRPCADCPRFAAGASGRREIFGGGTTLSLPGTCAVDPLPVSTTRPVAAAKAAMNPVSAPILRRWRRRAWREAIRSRRRVRSSSPRTRSGTAASLQGESSVSSERGSRSGPRGTVSYSGSTAATCSLP